MRKPSETLISRLKCDSLGSSLKCEVTPNTSFQRARVRGDRGLGPLNSKR